MTVKRSFSIPNSDLTHYYSTLVDGRS